MNTQELIALLMLIADDKELSVQGKVDTLVINRNNPNYLRVEELLDELEFVKAHNEPDGINWRYRIQSNSSAFGLLVAWAPASDRELNIWPFDLIEAEKRYQVRHQGDVI